ncbi:VTT domain-containing protein [Streptomyces sp. 71268]|uniref:VTT domain-containing protein n=1 Tax=Streptomyces sp. 71268 TaxID=3002640 RepID=UPI0023F6F15E|nr:VTT domain-containing protein [Streptomyces sp. 71268]WEV26905.1 VTT domain-containing protein [Streptomyces sp. 71268]
MTTLALGPSWLDPDHLIDQFGIYGVLAIVFAESGLLIGFFLPGDSLLFTTGLFVTTDMIDMDLWLVCLLVVVAAVAGDQAGYLFGRKVGPALFKRPDSKLFKQENVEKAHDFFEKYGPKSLVLARFVPIVRTFTPIIAGVSRMNYRSFITFNIIGGVLWGAGVTLLGAALGKVKWVHSNIEAMLIGIVLLSVLPIIIEVLRARSQNKKAAAAEGGATARSTAAPSTTDVGGAGDTPQTPGEPIGGGPSGPGLGGPGGARADVFGHAGTTTPQQGQRPHPGQQRQGQHPQQHQGQPGQPPRQGQQPGHQQGQQQSHQQSPGQPGQGYPGGPAQQGYPRPSGQRPAQAQHHPAPGYQDPRAQGGYPAGDGYGQQPQPGPGYQGQGQGQGQPGHQPHQPGHQPHQPGHQAQPGYPAQGAPQGDYQGSYEPQQGYGQQPERGAQPGYGAHPGQGAQPTSGGGQTPGYGAGEAAYDPAHDARPYQSDDPHAPRDPYAGQPGQDSYDPQDPHGPQDPPGSRGRHARR